jgi:hypothetical protein
MTTTDVLPSVEDALAQESRSMNRDIILVESRRFGDDLLVVVYDCEVSGEGWRQRQRRYATWTPQQASAAVSGVCWIETETKS